MTAKQKGADAVIRHIALFVKRRYLFKDKEKAIPRTRAYTNVRNAKRGSVDKAIRLIARFVKTAIFG